MWRPRLGRHWKIRRHSCLAWRDRWRECVRYEKQRPAWIKLDSKGPDSTSIGLYERVTPQDAHLARSTEHQALSIYLNLKG